MNRKRKRKPSAPWRPPAVDDAADDARRASAIVAQARALLRPFAEDDVPRGCTGPAHARYDALGGHDGVGALLALAGLGGPGTGGSADLLDAAEAARFLDAAASLGDSLQQAALNYAVIFSLFLTIFAALAATAEPYAESEGGAWPGDHVDAATALFGPLGDDAVTRARQSFFVIEAVLASLGVSGCCVLLYRCNFLFVAFSNGLPNDLAKMEFFVDSPRRFATVGIGFNLVMMTLLIDLAFVAARVCAVKMVLVFVLGFGAYLAVGLQDFYSRHGAISALTHAQHREAHILFRRLDDARRSNGR